MRNLAFAVLFALPLCAQSVDPVKAEEERQKLQAEAKRLKEELDALRKVEAARAEVERLKREIEEVKDPRKRKPGEQKPKPPIRIRMRPEAPPVVEVGDIVVTQDADGVWWTYELRSPGLISMHEFGKGDDAKTQAESYVANCKKDRR